MTDRILVTGSRHYGNPKTRGARLAVADRAQVTAILGALYAPGRILVHGDADGLDHLARDAWHALQAPVLGVPADWRWLGKKAGPIRNQTMVDMGGYLLCVAFPLAQSVGTWDCVHRAREAGIPTLVVQP